MKTSGYSLLDYGSMILSEPRMGAFDRALRQAITPGCHVIDLGAGPGLFALLACKYGAGSVVAIEPDPSIEIARRAAVSNGFADRITFVKDVSTAYQPHRRADVVVSDIRGVMPLYEHHIATTKDTRNRLLAPGGVLIPGVDRIFAALVEAPETYDQHYRPWHANDYGVDLSAGHDIAVNSWRRVFLTPPHLLTAPQLFATLDYATVTDTNHKSDVIWRAERPGTVHGILMWFETDLVPGIGYSNAPGQPELVYGQGFFPLERPVLLGEGAEARASISAVLVKGQYVWNWAFSATAADGTRPAFRQSSFKADLFPKDALAIRAATFRPPARKVQEIDRLCLELFTGDRTLLQIADTLLERFPDYFRDASAAFDHVARLSARYNA